MKKSGVYKITNKVTGDFYIGSTNNFSRRFIQHRFNGSEKGARKHKMYNDMRKYGIDSFEFEILEETNEYRVREKYYIDTLNPTYNIETETSNNMDLKEEGFLVDYIDGQIVKLKKPIENFGVYEVPDNTHHLSLLMISDSHLTNKADRIDILNYLYDKAESKGIKYVLHCGD